MWIIVRNTEGGPPTCGCKHCYKPPPPKPPPGPPPPRVMIDEWIDLRAGDPWPTDKKLIKALNRNLNTHSGENPEQYVALWYQQGEPVMGRIWNNNGKVRIINLLHHFFTGTFLT